MGGRAPLIGACAQLGTRAPQDVEFELSGRLAARYGNEAFSGNLAWRHARSSDDMLITSSLGAGVARIVRDKDSVVLTTAEMREYRAADAETLTEEVLGFRLPLAGLADWVRGRPSDPRLALIEQGPEGRLRSLGAGTGDDYLGTRGERPSRMRRRYKEIDFASQSRNGMNGTRRRQDESLMMCSEASRRYPSWRRSWLIDRATRRRFLARRRRIRFSHLRGSKPCVRAARLLGENRRPRWRRVALEKNLPRAARGARRMRRVLILLDRLWNPGLGASA